ASIDLRLGRHFLKVNEDDFDIIRMDQPITYMEVERDEIIIPPHTFMLATTMEYVKLPNDLTAFVEGRSSVGRLGLFVRNAGWVGLLVKTGGGVDRGCEGELPLELSNATRQPIRLQAGRRVCQLVFARMDRAALVPYKGKYMGQRKPVGSRLHQDADRR